MKFNVTYEIVTPESAERGDTAENGFIIEGATLREALKLVYETRTSRVDGISSIEADEYPVTCPSWITVSNGMEFETGACESRSIHFPDNLSASTRCRIARLMDCYGID